MHFRALDANVLLLPGRACHPMDAESPFLRASFSLASREDIDEGFRKVQ